MCKILLLISYLLVGLVTSEHLFQLNVIHVNDIHARFDETSPTSTRCIGNGDDCVGGIARLYSAIRAALLQHPDAIVLNAGDTFQGTLWYNLFKWNVSQHFLNKLPCDAYTLGNHEFDDDIEGVVPFMKALHCPIVVANMDASQEPSMQGLFQKSTVIVRNGTRIGVIGVIISTANKISNTGRLNFTDELLAINLEAEKLTKTSNCSIVIVLSHCGIELDKRIAREAHPRVSLIVGGHSHTFLYSGAHPPGPERPQGPYPLEVRNRHGGTVLVVQASFNTKYLGNITVWYDRDWRVGGFEGGPVYLDRRVPKDPDMNADVQEWKKEVNKFGNDVLGTSKVLLDRSTRRMGESNLGSFLTDAMVHYYVNKSDNNSWTFASIAIINSGALRTSINPGDVTIYDIINCHPFQNTIDLVELTGRNIKDFLEYSVTPSVVRNGQLHEFLQVSGIRVTYNLSMPVGSRVTRLHLLCNQCLVPTYAPVDYSRTYRVIVPSYLVHGGDGYDVIKHQARRRVVGPQALDVFSEFVRARTPLTHGQDERITVAEVGVGGTGVQHSNRSAHVHVPLIFYIVLYTFGVLLC